MNGHDTVVLLDSGATVSSFDKAYAASVGLQASGSLPAPGGGGVETAGLIGGVEVQVANLTLRHLNTLALDFAPVAARIGHPLPFVLGNELFNQLTVDIDFARRRLAFHDPAGFTAPADATVVPLIRTRGNRSVPVSIEGAAPVQFDFDLGNGSPLLVFPAFYQAHKLLEGRRASQTLGGAVGGFHPEVAATLSQVEFAGIRFTQVPARFTADTLSDVNSNLTQGNIGLPILARFRLIIDYAHDRLYAAPQPEAASTAFAKDRLGLSWVKRDAALAVDFVSPGSPAQEAGFKAGDKIALINGKPSQAWTEPDLAALRYGTAATSLAFTMQDGAVRRVKLGDFF